MQPKIKQVLLRAAKLRQVNLTDFMVESSYVAAQIALADRTHFTLSPQKWEEFNAALDAPPKDIPALRQLFRTPSVFKSA